MHLWAIYTKYRSLIIPMNISHILNVCKLYAAIGSRTVIAQTTTYRPESDFTRPVSQHNFDQRMRLTPLDHKQIIQSRARAASGEHPCPGPGQTLAPYIWAEKFEGFKRINSICDTNGNFDSCNSCKRLVPSRLHELHESKFPFVSRIEFIRSKLLNFSAHVYEVLISPVRARTWSAVRRPSSATRYFYGRPGIFVLPWMTFHENRQMCRTLLFGASKAALRRLSNVVPR